MVVKNGIHKIFWFEGFDVWDSCCFNTCCHEFMSVIKLYLVNFLHMFLFFIGFNSGERLFHILIPW